MQPKIEQMVKDAIQPHLQPLLDKQVILEETVSQLQNNNANLKAKIDLKLDDFLCYGRYD
jgi:hypothetical protein